MQHDVPMTWADAPSLPRRVSQSMPSSSRSASRRLTIAHTSSSSVYVLNWWSCHDSLIVLDLTLANRAAGHSGRGQTSASGVSTWVSCAHQNHVLATRQEPCEWCCPGVGVLRARGTAHDATIREAEAAFVCNLWRVRPNADGRNLLSPAMPRSVMAEPVYMG